MHTFLGGCFRLKTNFSWKPFHSITWKMGNLWRWRLCFFTSRYHVKCASEQFHRTWKRTFRFIVSVWMKGFLLVGQHYERQNLERTCFLKFEIDCDERYVIKTLDQTSFDTFHDTTLWKTSTQSVTIIWTNNRLSVRLLLYVYSICSFNIHPSLCFPSIIEF